jgi:hypothetical protein
LEGNFAGKKEISAYGLWRRNYFFGSGNTEVEALMAPSMKRRWDHMGQENDEREAGMKH